MGVLLGGIEGGVWEEWCMSRMKKGRISYRTSELYDWIVDPEFILFMGVCIYLIYCFAPNPAKDDFSSPLMDG